MTAMLYDLYRFDGFDLREGTPVLTLWRTRVCVNDLFREFGFPAVKDKLRDLRHLEGIFLTPDYFLIPTDKQPRIG